MLEISRDAAEELRLCGLQKSGGIYNVDGPTFLEVQDILAVSLSLRRTPEGTNTLFLLQGSEVKRRGDQSIQLYPG